MKGELLGASPGEPQPTGTNAAADPWTGRRVLHVWFDDYPWDVRVQKVTLGLVRSGWQVDIVARNRRARESVGSVDGARVYRLRRQRWLPAALDSLLSFPAFVNPRWIYHIWRSARRTKPDLILVRDLPLAPAALWVGRLRRIPVVLDMAENYAGLLRTLWDAGAAKPFDYLVRNPRFAAWVERWTLPRLDGVVCVIEESAARVQALGVAGEKIAVVRNTPWPAAVAQLPRHRVVSGATLTIAYLGFVEHHRGVHELVQAVAECRRQGMAVDLKVIGDGIGFGALEALARELGVLGNGVALLGRMENQAALTVVAAADVGAIPHLPSDAWNATIPNKLFDYMSLGLPVLSSNVIPVERIIREEGCGVAYVAGDIPDLVRAIGSLLPAERRRAMGAAGMRAVQQRYNWDVDARVLDQALARVLPRPIGG